MPSRKTTGTSGEDVEMLISMANTARREGILALEGSAEDIQDPFLKKGIMMIVDGSDPELIKGILETDLEFVKGTSRGKPHHPGRCGRRIRRLLV